MLRAALAALYVQFSSIVVFFKQKKGQALKQKKGQALINRKACFCKKKDRHL